MKAKVTSKQTLLDLKWDKCLPNLSVTADEKSRCERVAEYRPLSLGTLVRQLLPAEADQLENEKTEAA